MQMNIPDNYDQFLAHERKQEILRSKFPTCDRCGTTLYEFLFRIYGEVLCESCVNDIYREGVTLDE